MAMPPGAKFALGSGSGQPKRAVRGCSGVRRQRVPRARRDEREIAVLVED